MDPRKRLEEDFKGTPTCTDEKLKTILLYYLLYSDPEVLAPCGHEGADASTRGQVEATLEALFLLRDGYLKGERLAAIVKELKGRYVTAKSHPSLKNLNPNQQFDAVTGYYSGRGSGFYFVLQELYDERPLRPSPTIS